MRVTYTPRPRDHEDMDRYLEALEMEEAVRRDDRLTSAERAAAHQSLAECHGLPWRPEWVVRP